MRKIEVGDFISVPVWKTFGLVVGLLLPHYGSENVQHVLLQEDSESIKKQHYHLEPGEFNIMGAKHE